MAYIVEGSALYERFLVSSLVLNTLFLLFLLLLFVSLIFFPIIIRQIHRTFWPLLGFYLCTLQCDVCTDTRPPVLSPIQDDYVIYSKSLTQGDCSRINAWSGNQTSAPVQALDQESNSLPLGYRACTIWHDIFSDWSKIGRAYQGGQQRSRKQDHRTTTTTGRESELDKNHSFAFSIIIFFVCPSCRGVLIPLLFHY